MTAETTDTIFPRLYLKFKLPVVLINIPFTVRHANMTIESDL